MKTKSAKKPEAGAGGSKSPATPQDVVRASEGGGFVSTDELARRLGVCTATLLNWKKAGRLPSVQIERRILWHLPSVEAALLRLQRGGNIA